MARGELLKKLFSSYSQGNNEAFRSVALQLIDEEEQHNNRVLANALRRSLGSPNSLTDLPQRKLEIVPQEKDKRLPLVEQVEPEKRPSDIVLSRTNQHLLLSILEEFRRNELIRSHGLSVRSKLLFCGPPGCAKTLYVLKFSPMKCTCRSLSSAWIHWSLRFSVKPRRT